MPLNVRMESVYQNAALDMGVKHGGVTGVQSAAVDIGAQQFIVIRDRSDPLDMGVQLDHIAHVDSAVAVDVTDHVQLDIQIDFTVCDFDPVGSGHMVLLADHDAVAAAGDAGEGEVDLFLYTKQIDRA